MVCRLEWVLQSLPEVLEAAKKGSAVYGMMDSWFLYRLSGNKLHVSDASCTSASGLFDPFSMQYVPTLLQIYGIPASMLPAVCDSIGDHFGSTSPDIFGHAIPIRCSVSHFDKALSLLIIN